MSIIDRIIGYERQYIATRARELAGREARISSREDRLRELQNGNDRIRAAVARIKDASQETIRTASELE